MAAAAAAAASSDAKTFHQIQELPLNDSKSAVDFRKAWDFYIISAHGTLIPHMLATIPNSMYLKFNSPSGCISVVSSDTLRRFMPFQEDIVSDDIITFYEQMYEHAKNRTSFLHTWTIPTKVPSSVIPTEGYSEVHQPPSYYEYPTTFFNSSNSLGRSTIALKSSNVETGIYKPNSSVFDMRLTFANNHGEHPMLLGVYKLPIPTRLISTMLSTTSSDERSNKGIFGQSDGYNLFPELIGTDIRLSDVLTKLYDSAVYNASKKNCVFITSCRGLPFYIEPTKRNAMGRLVRSASMSGRSNVPANTTLSSPVYYNLASLISHTALNKYKALSSTRRRKKYRGRKRTRKS